MTDYSKSTTVLCTLTEDQLSTIYIYIYVISVLGYIYNHNFLFEKCDSSSVDLTENRCLQRFLNLEVEIKEKLLHCIGLHPSGEHFKDTCSIIKMREM